MKDLFLAIFAAIAFAGCVNPAPGSDKLVVQAEQLRIDATKTLDAFIQWVDRNPGLGADVLAARELAATSGPVYIRHLRECTRTYKAAREPGNADRLEASITALRGLLELIRTSQTAVTH